MNWIPWNKNMYSQGQSWFQKATIDIHIHAPIHIYAISMHICSLIDHHKNQTCGLKPLISLLDSSLNIRISNSWTLKLVTEIKQIVVHIELNRKFNQWVQYDAYLSFKNFLKIEVVLDGRWLTIFFSYLAITKQWVCLPYNEWW